MTADAAAVAEHGPFDIIMLLEVLHDLARPVDALGACRSALAEGGVVLVADENVAETFTAPPGDELERMMCGWSVTHCCPPAASRSGQQRSGRQSAPISSHRLATDAGFADTDVVDVEAGFSASTGSSPDGPSRRATAR